MDLHKTSAENLLLVTENIHHPSRSLTSSAHFGVFGSSLWPQVGSKPGRQSPWYCAAIYMKLILLSQDHALSSLGLGRKRALDKSPVILLTASDTAGTAEKPTSAAAAGSDGGADPSLLLGLKPLRDRYLSTVLTKLTSPVQQVTIWLTLFPISHFVRFCHW